MVHEVHLLFCPLFQGGRRGTENTLPGILTFPTITLRWRGPNMNRVQLISYKPAACPVSMMVQFAGWGPLLVLSWQEMRFTEMGKGESSLSFTASWQHETLPGVIGWRLSWHFWLIWEAWSCPSLLQSLAAYPKSGFSAGWSLRSVLPEKRTFSFDLVIPLM